MADKPGKRKPKKLSDVGTTKQKEKTDKAKREDLVGNF